MSKDVRDLIFIWGAAIVIAAGTLFYISSAVSADDQIPPFDHSNCQYPNRLSNPPNGCDNSDPARPECMKIGTEDCNLPYPVQPTTVPVTNIPPTPDDYAPPVTDGSTCPVTGCGGS